jgi:hypothetical protein
MPASRRPFAGYIRSSIELFSAFHRAGFNVSPDRFIGGVCEVYPGNIWRRLAGRLLPKKSTDDGRRARKYVLEALGVFDLPNLPTHDQNDACVAAVMAAAADGRVPGVSVRYLGWALEIEANGTLREGPMAIPEIAEDAGDKIEKALCHIPPVPATETNLPLQPPLNQDAMNRATALLDRFIESALKGNSQICTYAYAYRDVFKTSPPTWSQAYGKKIVSVAARTVPRELPGLGLVRLDAFLVAKRTGLPSEGHWASADYDREDWERILGNENVLH